MNQNHKYKTGRRVMNWRVAVLLVGILWCAVVGSHSNDDNVYVREQDVFMKPVVVVPEHTIEDKIKEYFPRNWKTMIAIAHAESGVSMDAIGYNCYYTRTVYYDEDVKNALGQVIHKKGEVKIPSHVLDKKAPGSESKSCNKVDRSKAWSVDCFVLQKNYPGRKSCPEGVTIDMHLREMAELSKSRGFQPWVTYNLKMHEQYLEKLNGHLDYIAQK